MISDTLMSSTRQKIFKIILRFLNQGSIAIIIPCWYVRSAKRAERGDSAMTATTAANYLLYIMNDAVDDLTNIKINKLLYLSQGYYLIKVREATL